MSKESRSDSIGSGAATSARWARRTARILGAAVVTVIVVIFIAHIFGVEEGDRTGLTLNGILIDVLFFAVLVGYPLGWMRERLGGLLIVLGMTGVYAVNFISFGIFPGGWFFPLMFIPGILYLVSFRIRPDASIQHPDSRGRVEVPKQRSITETTEHN